MTKSSTAQNLALSRKRKLPRKTHQNQWGNLKITKESFWSRRKSTMAGTILIFTCNLSQRSSEAWFPTQTMKMPPPKLPVFHQVNQMTEFSKRVWTTLNTTVKTTEPHNTSPAKCLSSQSFNPRTDTTTVDSPHLRHLPCTSNMKTNASKLSYTTAETTVKAWVELLVVDLAAITGTKVSVKP